MRALVMRLRRIGRLRHRGEHPEYRRTSKSAGRVAQSMAVFDWDSRLESPCADPGGGTRRAAERIGVNVLDIVCLRSRRTSGTRPVAEGRRDRQALRLPDHEFHGRDVDRRRGPHRVRPARDATHDAGSGRRAELPGMAGGEPLRPAREHHRPAPGRADVLVLCHHLHLHSRRQLGRPDSGRRHDRLGASDRRMASSSSSRCSAGPTPIST